MSREKLKTPGNILRDVKEISQQDKIKSGICVSPYTVDYCPHCVDICEAARNRIKKP